jgi:histidinol-phosphate aminotransferase
MTSLPKPRPGIMDIHPYVAGKSKIAAPARKVMKLSSNETPLGPSPRALKAYADHSTEMHRYPESGCASLREALGKAHGLDPARIVCGNGSDELIGLLVNAYAGEGDEVLYSEHGFAMYKIYAQGAGATPVAAPEQALTADVGALLSKVTPKTRLLFLANPNNPTGTYLPAVEIARLRKQLRADIILVIDAAYAEYADVGDYASGRELVDTGENTVMLRTFSKIYGLAALRLGWGYFPAGIAAVLNRLRGPFNVSSPAIAAGIAALEDTVHIAKAKAHNHKWLLWVSDALSQLGLNIYPSLGNFVLAEFPDAKKTADAANAFLVERGIIVREMGGYGLPDTLRITIGTEEENRALVSALEKFLK